MPAILIAESAPAPDSYPQRKLWTREECDALNNAGLLDYDNLELIEGELIRKVSKTPRHGNTMKLIQRWLITVFGFDYIHSEFPIDVALPDIAANQPEPDLTVLRRPFTELGHGAPQPSDRWLAIEVSVSTLRFDLTVKAALYARAGIPEYWVLDVSGRRLIAHRAPSEGVYTSIEAYSEEESISPLSAPAHSLQIATLFPA